MKRKIVTGLAATSIFLKYWIACIAASVWVVLEYMIVGKSLPFKIGIWAALAGCVVLGVFLPQVLGMLLGGGLLKEGISAGRYTGQFLKEHFGKEN